MKEKPLYNHECDFLFDFQKEGVNNILASPYYGLFWEMGTGKTITTLCALKNMGLKALVVAPKSLLKLWAEDEVDKFGLDLNTQIIEGDKKKRAEQYYKFADHDLTVISYEMVRNDAVTLKRYLRVPFVLVLDEASKLKNLKTKVRRAVMKIRWSRNCIFAIALTGTPIENHLIDYFSIVNVINPGWMRWQEFTSNYCVWGEIWAGRDRGYITVIKGFKNVDDFKNKIAPFSSRILKKDVNDKLPEKTITYRFIPHSPEQHKLYHDIIDTALASDLTFLHIYTLLRLLDDGISFYFLSESETKNKLNLPRVDEDENTKVNELKSILEEIEGRQAIIFTSFERVAEALSTKLNAIFVSGQTKNRWEIVNAFKNKKFDILFSTDTLAYGIDLPDVDYLINFDIHPNPMKMQQRIDRIHRVTSKRNKTIINFVGGGVEKKIYDILKAKSLLIERVLGKEVERVNIMKILAEEYGFKR